MDVMITDDEFKPEMASSIARAFQGFDQTLEVRMMPLASLFHLRNTVEQDLQQNGGQIRGLIFKGHGNSDLYAFSKKEIFKGNGKIEEIIESTLNLPMSHRVLLYFPGCSAAEGPHSFLNQLTEALAPISLRSEIELVGHMFATNTKRSALFKPTILDHFLVRSGIAPTVNRFQLILSPFVGGYSPTVVNLLTIFGVPGLVFILGGPDELKAMGIGMALAMKYITKSAEAYGKLTSNKPGQVEQTGFVYNLIKEHISPTKLRCPSVFSR